MSFGGVLRGLIEARGITQKQLALDLNLAPSTVGNYVRDQREPDYKTLKVMADYFEVSTDFLLERSHPLPDTGSFPEAIALMKAMPPSDRQIWLAQGRVLLRSRLKDLT